MSKCFLCSKSVYPAEKVQSDGKVFHNVCFQTYRKQQQLEYKHTKQCEYYKQADVKPAYYRVADKDSGAPQRMSTGEEEEENKQRIVQEEQKTLERISNSPRQQTSAPTTSSSNSCKGCGYVFKEHTNFCPSCGAKCD
ncbi:LIM zinc-binding domain-containing protein [Entamoeba marina]